MMLYTSGPTYLVVSTIFVPSDGDSARNWIMCPEDRGKLGLWEGGLPVS